MSADLDALDRGLVDVGVTAAEALARVEVLEAKVGVIFSMMRQLAEAGLPLPGHPGQPHLQVVRS